MSVSESITLTIAQPYTFAASVCDHGWPALAPFRWNDVTQTLERVERLAQGQVVLLHLQSMAEANQIVLNVEIWSVDRLTTAECDEVAQAVRWMLKERKFNKTGKCTAHPLMRHRAKCASY